MESPAQLSLTDFESPSGVLPTRVEAPPCTGSSASPDLGFLTGDVFHHIKHSVNVVPVTQLVLQNKAAGSMCLEDPLPSGFLK